MKQDMSMSLSVTTLTRTDRFSNSLQFRAEIEAKIAVVIVVKMLAVERAT